MRMRIDPWCELRSSNGVSPTTKYVFFRNECDQTVTSKISIDDNGQKLRKMGLLKVLTKIWLGQDLTKVKKSSQLQAFNALTAEEKAKAFDELTPEDKLEVLDEQLRILERCAKVNFDYFSLEEERAIRLLMVNPHLFEYTYYGFMVA